MPAPSFDLAAVGDLATETDVEAARRCEALLHQACVSRGGRCVSLPGVPYHGNLSFDVQGLPHWRGWDAIALRVTVRTTLDELWFQEYLFGSESTEDPTYGGLDAAEFAWGCGPMPASTTAPLSGCFQMKRKFDFWATEGAITVSAYLKDVRLVDAVSAGTLALCVDPP